MRKLLFIPFCLILIGSSDSSYWNHADSIDGVNFVAPSRKLEANPFDPVVSLGAEWISVMPYAFSAPFSTTISFDQSRQWFGETTAGARQTIKMARAKGLKIMLKPHVWIRGQGWCGDFYCRNEDDWKCWEESYGNYIMHMVDLANEFELEMICIGTEYRKAVVERPKFWESLISNIRTQYNGKITYAANWDNFEKVKFWNLLDYIGVDAYFPLHDDKVPSKSEMIKAWKPHKEVLSRFSRKWEKPILFTEYGYRSVDYTARRPWETGNFGAVNHELQIHAYEAMYEACWREDWMAGGFLWKWFDYHDRAGGHKHAGFTPQNKPVIHSIQHWYKN